ncbi:hypothetical protein ElyMa_002909400, partial [Elysia marginata]
PKPSLKKTKDYIVSVFNRTKPRKFFQHRKSLGVSLWSGTPKINTLESGTEKPPSVVGESSISIGQASSTLLNERASIGTSRSLNTIVSDPVVASQTSIETVEFGASKETVAIRASKETV